MKGWMSRVRPSTRVSMIVFAALALTIGALLFGGGATAAGPPADLPGVPHYFGPFPNWANSPLAQPAATVTINGNGAGAQATATVGANGAVTGLTITATGGGYTAATVSISGPGSGATATAFVQRSGAVNGVTLPQGGQGYTTPSVTFSGGGATTQATAHALGRVDALAHAAREAATRSRRSCSGCRRPNGTQAQGHATCAAPYPDCNLTNPDDTLTVTGVVVDNRGFRIHVGSERHDPGRHGGRSGRASRPGPLHRGDGVGDAHAE